MVHSYPQELTKVLIEKWDTDGGELLLSGTPGDVPSDQLPDVGVIEEIISTCYQASMLREEERPLRFRLMLREPEKFQPEAGPPDGLHRLIFREPRPFNEYELRKLVPAADFQRSLVGVSVNSEGTLQTWGVMHSGPRWIQAVRGGSLEFSPLPHSLVLYITGPGQIAVCKGSIMLAMLNGGKILTPSWNVFDARWLRERQADTHRELWDLHQASRSHANRPWALLERNFPNIIGQQVLKRIMSIVRSSHHGGTLISLAPHRASELCSENRYLTIKYPFREEEPRKRFRTLLVKLMDALAESYGEVNQPDRVVGWKEYVMSKNEMLSLLDEAVFEYAHFVAGLTAVDGAVVLSQRHELLGFGGMILGPLDKVRLVAQSLDSEGESTEMESVDGVGMRHRAVYHFCNELHDTLAIVISQDGNVRLVTWKNGIVTCWDVVPLTLPQFPQ
jgi:hypothetical protein